VMLISRWVILRARCVMLISRWVILRARWGEQEAAAAKAAAAAAAEAAEAARLEALKAAEAARLEALNAARLEAAAALEENEFVDAEGEEFYYTIESVAVSCPSPPLLSRSVL
jgi:hypothetical protein